MALDNRKLPRFVGPSRYLTEILAIKDKWYRTARIGIDGPISTITQRPGSHKAAWARILQASLRSLNADLTVDILTDKSCWNDYDYIILDFGMEFDGVLNMFGGATDIVADKFQRIIDARPMLICYEIPMPDLGEIVRARRAKSEPKFAALDDVKLSQLCKQVEWADQVKPCDHVIIGDSHVLSVWQPDSEIRRYDGKTLHGALEKGLVSFLPPDREVKKITTYFGNIDVRHHLLRQENTLDETEKLVQDYLDQHDQLIQNGLAEETEIISLLPVEDESRRLPKTGYYKGTPFYGSQEDRQGISAYFNALLVQRLSSTKTKIHVWPTYFEEQEKLKFEVMEAGGSVHLSPEWYRTDLTTGKPRDNQQIVRLSEATPNESNEPGPAEPEIQNPQVGHWRSAEPNIQNIQKSELKTHGDFLAALPVSTVGEKIEQEQIVRSKIVKLTFNDYYKDSLDYYWKALQLQRRNVGLSFTEINDPLMNAVSIYDTVNRRFAGFSKVLEDLHYGQPGIKFRTCPVPKPGDFDLARWQYLHLVHRITGSGASFEKDHGYRNSIVTDLAGVIENPETWQATARDFILERQKQGPIFTSIGNTIPMFNKPSIPGYERGGIEYLCEFAPKLASDMAQYLRDKSRCNILVPIRDAVDWALDWQTAHGMKRFHFVLTAWVMDTAEYMPYLVDPASHCYYGKNCVETMNMVATSDAKRDLFNDLVMESWMQDCEDNAREFHQDFSAAGNLTPQDLPVMVSLQSDHAAIQQKNERYARPYDLEDGCGCDYIRYVENYIPNGKLGSYEHLDRSTLFNNSLIKNHPKGRQREVPKTTESQP